MLSIIVPAYNEAGHIKDNLAEISKALKSFAGDDYEIIAVNDGSKDKTGEEIKEACLEDSHIVPAGYEANRGKGGAICEGVRHSRGSIVGFIDADLDLSPDLIEGYVRAMEDNRADIVIGSKMHKDSELEYPFARKFVSFGYYVMLKVLFGLKCHDTQTGLKLYRGELIRQVAPIQKIKGYAFDIEMLALASRGGKTLIEMPVKLDYSRNTSFGRIRFKDVFKMFTDTWKIWWDLRVRKSYPV